MNLYESVRWSIAWEIEKQWIDGPSETITVMGNVLTYVGISSIFETLVGRPTGNVFGADAAIGVGDSALDSDPSQTDLQGGLLARKAMDTGYPQHTDGVGPAAAIIIFRATFGTTDANFEWNEWGIFSTSLVGQGRMLNRRVYPAGTKTSRGIWVVTASVVLS